MPKNSVKKLERIGEILSRVVVKQNLFTLYLQHPDLFDLTRLPSTDIATLCSMDDDLAKTMEMESFTPDQKVALFFGDSKYKYLLTTEVLKKLRFSQYNDLVLKDKSFLNADVIREIPKTYHSAFFSVDPDWFVNNIGLPHLTCHTATSLAHRKPKLVDKYLSENIYYTTDDGFWISMLTHNYDKYSTKFIENMDRMSTHMTRSVIRVKPRLIQLLTPALISSGKISAKEWVYVIRESWNHRRLKDYVLPDDIKQELELSLTSELLSGDSTNSKRLRNAMDYIFNRPAGSSQ